MNNLHEEMTDELYDKIVAVTDEDYFKDTYCDINYFKDEWDDYIREAAEGADITPGQPARIAMDPNDSDPGFGDQLNSYTIDYDDVNDELFKMWLEDISRDSDVSDLLRDNMNDEDIIDMLRQLYDEMLVPFNLNEYEEQIMEYAGEYLNDYNYDDSYDWD